MRGRKSGRSSFFCKQQVAPSIDPALAGEKPVRPIRAPGFSRAGESAEVFRLASIRRQVLQALLSPTVPQDRRRQTPLQSVLWLSLLRGAGQSPILLFLLILLARRGSSARRVLPAPRETFRCARVPPGLRANLRALFPATMDSLSETARPFPQFSCARLQTVSRKRAPAVRLKRFLCVPFREVFLKCLEFLFPSNPSAQRSLRAQVLAARAPSLAPEFPRGCRAPEFPETRRVPDHAASDVVPADRAPRLRQSSRREKITARGSGRLRAPALRPAISNSRARLRRAAVLYRRAKILPRSVPLVLRENA